MMKYAKNVVVFQRDNLCRGMKSNEFLNTLHFMYYHHLINEEILEKFVSLPVFQDGAKFDYLIMPEIKVKEVSI